MISETSTESIFKETLSPFLEYKNTREIFSDIHGIGIVVPIYRLLNTLKQPKLLQKPLLGGNLRTGRLSINSALGPGRLAIDRGTLYEETANIEKN